ncbi:MAG TPA: hypothetical protein VGS07_29365 [Thermoanaerobaculia bacterium]|nr:hypothetical protein [Thermoanaerobaculia bacterium]
MISQGVQILEKEPEHHPPVIATTGALKESEPSLDALKLSLD